MTDYGQHVSMGCCTALADLLARAGLADTFEPHDRLHFIAPDGRRRTLLSTPWLPAPLHLLPSLLRLNFLSLAERWRIVTAMWAMKKLDRDAQPRQTNSHSSETPPTAYCLPPTVPDEPVSEWLRRHGQSAQAIERFWSPVLMSALSETPDHASFRLSRKVIVDGLLASRRAYELRIPRLPLTEIFDRRLGAWLVSRGVTIHRLTRVARIEGDPHRATTIVLAAANRDGPRPTAHGLRTTNDERRTTNYDALILAVPWDRIASLLSPELSAALPNLQQLDRIAPAAIATVHLAYDRPITDLPHAVLVGRLGQWLFAKPGNRYQVVISASHRLVNISREELGWRIEHELAETFPAAASAHVIHRRVVIQPRAVFSARPGVEQLRPPQATPIKNLALAGDWTATGWPATMESAVRSGNAAADAILRAINP